MRRASPNRRRSLGPARVVSFLRMIARPSQTKNVDTIEELAEPVENMDDVSSDVNGRFADIGNQISALQQRLTAVEGKITGLHRRIQHVLQPPEAA